MVITLLVIAVVGSPALLVVAIGLTLLIGRPLDERYIARSTYALSSTAFLAAVGLGALLLGSGRPRLTFELGRMVDLPGEHFHFTIKFLFDHLSVPFVILSLALCGIVGAFARVYLHRDEGYARFFLLYSVFTLGMVVSSVAGTIETLFLGWELVGLSSALLVAFFQNRINPVSNGLRIWTIYRVADGAFLLAALVLHHLTGGGDLDLLMGATPWPDSVAAISSQHAWIVGTLLLIAAAGKSALVPFSGWLPRAMEGPTPSSAIFYGALSVHLGAFLLLRVGPMIEQSFALQVMIVVLGLITAIYAAIVGSVQTDVKSSLAFASLLQVSIIVVEIGLGLRYLALLHIIGHACMRTLQLLRAPSLLRDHQRREDNLGHPAPFFGRSVESQSPSKVRLAFYRLALERGYFDTVLDQWVAGPFVRLFCRADRLERRWSSFMAGRRVNPGEVVPADSEAS